MRYAFGTLGFVAASVLLLVSAAMNWRFGFSLGRSEMDSQIYGAASAAADGFKALIPFFVLWALSQRAWFRALAGVLLWMICSTYSLTSSLGFAAMNRADTMGKIEVQATRYNDTRIELDRARKQMEWMPKYRSPGIVEAALQEELMKPVKGKRRTTLGKETKDCTRTNFWSAKLCENVLKLRKELAIAKQAESLQKRIDFLQANLATLTTNATAVKTKGKDPQVAMLESLTGVDAEKVQVALTILVSLLVEVGSGLGFFVVFGPSKMSQKMAQEALGRKARAAETAATQPARIEPVIEAEAIETSSQPVQQKIKETTANDNDINHTTDEDERTERAEPATAEQNADEAVSSSVRKFVMTASDVKRFYAERIEKAEGSTITATALYEQYCAWCKINGRKPVTLPAFGRQFSDLGIQKAKIAGRIRYISVKLKEVNTSEGVKKSPKNGKLFQNAA